MGKDEEGTPRGWLGWGTTDKKRDKALAAAQKKHDDETNEAIRLAHIFSARNLAKATLGVAVVAAVGKTVVSATGVPLEFWSV